MDEVEKMEGNEEEAEKPEIYIVKKGEKGFAYNRRGFLVTAAAGGAALGMIGMGIGSMVPDGQPGSVEGMDESRSVELEVEALAMALVPLAKGLEKAWKITNRGKNPSPKAVLNLSEAHDAGFQQALEVPEIVPGQTVEVPVSLTAPGKAGEYRFQWQLRLGDGSAKLNEFVLKVTDASLAESAHPYSSLTDQLWTINNPDLSAMGSLIHFYLIEVETNYDYIYVRDGSGNVVQTLTGDYPSGLWSSTVPGSVVQVRLTTDSSIEKWGFMVDQIISTNLTYHTYMPIINRPAPTPTSYVTCLCNTVEVCTCNLVCVCDSYCSCNTVCTCDGHCSCNQVCTCDTVHYWYPN
jgi:hypothetical protein